MGSSPTEGGRPPSSAWGCRLFASGRHELRRNSAQLILVSSSRSVDCRWCRAAASASHPAEGEEADQFRAFEESAGTAPNVVRSGTEAREH